MNELGQALGLAVTVLLAFAVFKPETLIWFIGQIVNLFGGAS